MAGSFPTSVTAYTNPGPNDVLGIDVGARTHDEFHADSMDDLEAVMTKLGTGASTAAANQVLRGTGAGTTAFGSVATGDLAANAVTKATYQQEASAVDTSSTSFVNIMTLAVTTSGGPLLIMATNTWYLLSGTPGNVTMGLRLDSGSDLTLARGGSVYGGTGWYGPFPLIHLFTGVSAGEHTVALRGLVAGSGTVESFDRSLLALELLR